MGILKAVIDYFKPQDYTKPGAGLGRNDACWCGSGRKYKKCHLQEDEKKYGASCSINCGPS